MKTTSNVEIEIRGKSDKKVFDKTLSLLKSDGKLVDQYKRLSVDLSPGFDPKTRSWRSDGQIDLRIKKSGNSEKISLKIGKIHAKKRREIEVRLIEGEFLNAVSLLENLGYNKGMLYFWESWEFEYKGYKVKLSKYTNDYFTWEIESEGKNDPFVLATQLGLKPYSKSEYSKALDWENKNIHNLYTNKLTKKLLERFFGSK